MEEGGRRRLRRGEESERDHAAPAAVAVLLSDQAMSLRFGTPSVGEVGEGMAAREIRAPLDWCNDGLRRRDAGVGRKHKH